MYLKNFVKDSGYIVETNLDNQGIIQLHKEFKSPLSVCSW